jgi:hypothetical protein
MIFLVDLNFTLAIRRRDDRRPLAKLLPEERYREWLVNLLRPQTAIIVTARPKAWEERTLERIERQTGWRPQASCFNDGRSPPPAWKRRAFLELIAPRFGRDPAGYFAIECNPLTRAAYAAIGVDSANIPGDDEAPWMSLPSEGASNHSDAIIRRT